MRKLLFVLIFSLSLPCAGVGQTTNNPAQASTEKPAATSPELTEATRLSHEAVRLYDQKKYDDALSPAKRALELREKALGPDHELVATSLYNVAGIYRAQEQYADAETLFRRALKILEKKFGVDSKMNARALSGPDELRAAAVSAARRWRFSPTKLGGRPVKVIGTITFNFHL